MWARGVLLAHPISGGLDDVTRDIAGVPLEIHVPGAAMARRGPRRRGGGDAWRRSARPAERSRIDVAAELASRGRREETAAATLVRGGCSSGSR